MQDISLKGRCGEDLRGLGHLSCEYKIIVPFDKISHKSLNAYLPQCISWPVCFFLEWIAVWYVYKCKKYHVIYLFHEVKNVILSTEIKEIINNTKIVHLWTIWRPIDEAISDVYTNCLRNSHSLLVYYKMYLWLENIMPEVSNSTVTSVSVCLWLGTYKPRGSKCISLFNFLSTVGFKFTLVRRGKGNYNKGRGKISKCSGSATFITLKL